MTWTAYGTWLPGDERGFVSPKFECDRPERQNNEPGRPYDDGRRDLRRIAESKLSGDAVRLTRALAEVVRRQFEDRPNSVVRSGESRRSTREGEASTEPQWHSARTEARAAGITQGHLASLRIAHRVFTQIGLAQASSPSA